MNKVYRMVVCNTCGKTSLYDINTLPKDERGRPVLENCKREQDHGQTSRHFGKGF